MSMSTQWSNDNRQLTVTLPQQFNIDTHRDFKVIRDSVKDREVVCILDFSHTQYIDSSALGMLLMLREELGGDDAKIELIHCAPEVRNLLDLAQFGTLFTIK